MMTAILLAILLLADPATVRVERIPATARRVTFDPHDPQPFIPPMHAGENALTQARFDCHCEFDPEPATAAQDRVRLRPTRITLWLDDTIYLPTDVRLPLRTHEEGHRVINERIYDREAERLAREVAADLMSRSLNSAASAQDAFREQYLHKLARRAVEVNARYDQLTEHGKRDDLRVIDAIEQAFAADASSQPATAPTTSRTRPPALHEAR
jgi:hypothetical protein